MHGPPRCTQPRAGRRTTHASAPEGLLQRGAPPSPSPPGPRHAVPYGSTAAEPGAPPLVAARRSMFVHDRQFFIVDPARSLYNVTAMYASNMVANSALTVLNAGIFMLLMYALIGARA